MQKTPNLRFSQAAEVRGQNARCERHSLLRIGRVVAHSALGDGNCAGAGEDFPSWKAAILDHESPAEVISPILMLGDKGFDFGVNRRWEHPPGALSCLSWTLDMHSLR